MRSLAPFLPLMALSGVLSAVQVAAIVRTGLPATGWLLEYTPALFLFVWMMLDARKRRRVPCHEFGFLVGVYMPASLLWYVFWSRGWRGFLTLGAIAGLLILPWIASVVVYSILQGQ